MCFYFPKILVIACNKTESLKKIDKGSVNCESEILVCSEATRIFKTEEEKF